MSQNIDKLIEEISDQFSYNAELKDALKRIVPIMSKGKSEEIVSLLYDSLRRTKIFVMEGTPTKEDVDNCKNEVIGDTNKNVEFIEADRGEYDSKGVAAGAYINEPVFDENMELVGRSSLLYVEKLSEYNKLSEIYGTRINLSHLIHELGHAWASEMGEFVQQGDTFETNVGAYTSVAKVDKDKKQVETYAYEGLMIEEALNTIEEERVLCELLDISNISEIRNHGYVSSNYQGPITDMVKSYVEKFGQDKFDSYRFLKDKGALKEIEQALIETEAWQTLQTKEYTEKKKTRFNRINELEVSEDAKMIINDTVKKYSEDYFPDNSKFSPMQKLENVCTQVYNFSTAKYNFGILGNEHNLEIYKEIMTSMVSEGYVPKNQARDISDKEKGGFISQLKSQVKSDEELKKYEDDKEQQIKENEVEEKDLE